MEPLPRTIQVKDNQNLIIDYATPDIRTELLEFLHLHFYSKSPICYLTDYGRMAGKRDELVSKCLASRTSVTVRDMAGNLVAVGLNKIETKCPSVSAEVASTRTDSFILSLLKSLEEDIDVFTRYNVDKVLDVYMVVVDQQYGRLGLSTILIEIAMELARMNGAGAIKATAVSEYAARTFNKLGFDTVRTIEYVDFEYNGEKPLAKMRTSLLSEHSRGRFVARRLP